MKTIIKRRADQLHPGDIICHRGGGRSVVQHTVNHGVTINVHTATIGSIADSTKHHPTCATFDVEVDQLTPAQQHAEELVEMLWISANFMRNGTVAMCEHETKIRALLVKINPPSHRALRKHGRPWRKSCAALEEVMRGPGASTPQSDWKDRCASFRDLISRARATGVLK